MKTIPTEVKALLRTISGELLPIYLSKDQTFDPTDFTEKTVWKFKRRVMFSSGVILIQGNKIEYIETTL